MGHADGRCAQAIPVSGVTDFQVGCAVFAGWPVGGVYTLFESGRFETFVSPFRETSGDPISGAPPPSRWLVSSGGGSAPRWRADGNEIFYWSAESKKLMAAAVRADGARFDVGRPEPLFNARPLQEAYPITFYDVSADGRFLVNGVEAKSGTPSLGLIVNWPQLLQN